MLAIDVIRLGVAMIKLLMTFAHRAYMRLFSEPSTPAHGSDQETTSMHLQYVSWILRTSQDKTIVLTSSLGVRKSLVGPQWSLKGCGHS